MSERTYLLITSYRVFISISVDLRWGVQMKEVFQPPEKARSKSRDRQGGSKSHPVSPSRELASGYYWVVRDINIDGEGTKSEGYKF